MQHTKTFASPWEIMPGKTYYETLLAEIPKAKKRIVVAVMLLLAEKNVSHLLSLLNEAAARGVQVTLLFDNGAVRSHFIYKLDPGSERGQTLKDTFAAVEALASAGATIYTFSKVGLHPYRGRCHVKIVVIDNIVYTFGGVNFFDTDFRNADFMLRRVSNADADRLAELVEHIGTHEPPLPDVEIAIKDGSILFDGGEPGHSIIYERACELAAQATQVTYVSQMAPSGQLGKLLGETKTTAYFNRPEQMLRPHAWGQAFDQQRYKTDNAYTRPTFLHAKCILFELRSGKRAVLTGSNNFSYRGIAFGTQEIALFSTNVGLYRAIQTFIKKKVA